MLDRLRVADLKDEIVSMQSELNTVLFEQHQKSQMVIKNEVVPVQQQQAPPLQLTNAVQSMPLPTQRILHNVKMMQEPSQILKAKQEQKLYENIKNERVKIEIPEASNEVPKSAFNLASGSSTPMMSSNSTQPPKSPSQPKQMNLFDKLKNEQLNITPLQIQHTHQPPLLSPTLGKSLPQIKPPEPKQELDDFDIESEIRPNLIMKKCESVPSTQSSSKKASKPKEKEREFSPLSDYFNTKINAQSKNKTDPIKSESHDGSFDEWIQKELSLQLTSSNLTKKKENNLKCNKPQPKILDNDLSEIFEHHASPKSVEKQLDDLFSSTSKSSDLMAAPSPLTEFFHVEPSSLGEKTVENRLEALFGGAEEDSRKSSQQDLVETRLEQLFQGSVAENDESALDNASFLYKNQDMTYEMIQKQIHVSTSVSDNGNENSSNSNKRQWSGTCDMFTSANSSMLFPASSSPPSKRTCTAAPSVSFDNKWIEDNFDFASEIMSTETSGDDLTKHRSWNGNIDHRETMIGGIQSPHQGQFHLQSGDESIHHHQTSGQSLQQNDQHLNLMDRHDHLMESQIPNLNYEDVDDISRQVQNAIDSILNLQSSDPLHYQLDSSFLELNAITAPSGAPNSPINIQQSHSHQIQGTQNLQYQQPRQDNYGFDQKPGNMPKRKYSRMDDIGDCLIGGSNLDDSPSALALSEPHGVESSSVVVGEFVNNLLNCEEKSITTS